MKPESFLTLRSNVTSMFKPQKGSKDIVKIVHVTTVVLQSYENTFCAQKKQK